jgi:hypothetical protein
VRRAIGRNERAVRKAVRDSGELSGMLPAVAEVAYTLAKALDDGAGLATAAVARQLMAALDALSRSGDDSDPGVAALLAELSAPMGNGSKKR